jgi:hypothetical protein
VTDAVGSVQGSGAVTFTVPAGASAGQHVVTAVGQASGVIVHAAFTVVQQQETEGRESAND